MSGPNPSAGAQGPGRPDDLHGLGRWLEENRTLARRRAWRTVLFVLLGLLAALNLLIPNQHPHFGIDRFFGFWPLFGLLVGLLMIFLVKKVLQPLIKRPEDYYGDL